MVNEIRSILNDKNVYSGYGYLTQEFDDGTTNSVKQNAIIKIASTANPDVYTYNVTSSRDDNSYYSFEGKGLFSIQGATSNDDNLIIYAIPYNGSGTAQMTFSSNGDDMVFTYTVNDINRNGIIAYSSSYSLNRVQEFYTVVTQVTSTANPTGVGGTLNGTYTVDATTLSGALSGALSGNFNIDALGYSSGGEITVTGDVANIGNFSAYLNPPGRVVVSTAQKEGYNLIETLMAGEDHCYQHNYAILTAQSDLGDNYTIKSYSTGSVRVTYV